LPIGRLQRGDDFALAAAGAGAKICDRGEADRDIDRRLLKLLGDELDEFMLEGDGLCLQQVPCRNGEHPPDAHQRAIQKAAGCKRATFIDIKFKILPRAQSDD
jgi:hypothetical protein